MNLDSIKEQADSLEAENGKIKCLQEKAKELFKEFFSIMRESYPLWNRKMRMCVDEFVNDYIKCLEDNGFHVDNPKMEITNDSYKNISANYKNATIIMSAINYDGEHIFLDIDGNNSVEFWFGLPVEVPNYYVWKDNIVVNGKGLHDFGNDIYTAYEKFVDSFHSVNELEKVLSKIDENIKHFKDSIEKIDAYSLCIFKWGKEESYSDFEEFWASID